MEPPNLPGAELKPYELMQKAADFFERLRVPYRIVGSMASMAYSEARFTNDIDILVDLQRNTRAAPSESSHSRITTCPFRRHEAIRTRHQFNIIHVPSGLKLDDPMQRHRVRQAGHRTGAAASKRGVL